jgi:hypothetical protein
MSNQYPKSQNNLPSRAQVTAQQVQVLLHVVGMLSPYVLQPHRELENIPGQNAMNGEAATAAQTTFINVCSKLDAILADDTRWTMDINQTLENQLYAVYVTQQELLKEQIIATKEINLPHNKYRPTLYKLRDNTYAAILGDLDDLDNAGKIPAHLFDWLKQREAALDAGEPTPPQPKPPKRKKTK